MPVSAYVVPPIGIVESGIADFMGFAPIEDFTTIVAPAAGATDIATAHTFGVGGGFYKIPTSPNKNKYTAPSVGEPGSLKFTSKVEVFVPGSKKELHKLISDIKNVPGIVIARDANCAEGNFYQIGSACTPAFLTGGSEFDTGTTMDGVKGYKLTFEAATPPTTYSGAVVWKP